MLEEGWWKRDGTAETPSSLHACLDNGVRHVVWLTPNMHGVHTRHTRVHTDLDFLSLLGRESGQRAICKIDRQVFSPTPCTPSHTSVHACMHALSCHKRSYLMQNNTQSGRALVRGIFFSDTPFLFHQRLAITHLIQWHTRTLHQTVAHHPSEGGTQGH
jgi:hypothetical protein